MGHLHLVLIFHARVADMPERLQELARGHRSVLRLCLNHGTEAPHIMVNRLMAGELVELVEMHPGMEITAARRLGTGPAVVVVMRRAGRYLAVLAALAS